MASLDKLISEEDKLAERLVQTKPKVKETSDMQIARLKDANTISVATFGQQGKVNVLNGQVCTSPPALSPPSLLASNYEYAHKASWQMDEASTSEAK